ncbi:hypothetical protein SAMN04487769_2856 [Burkholderia sp. b14]|nr:hypothetical protein SAMN04487769_2856 [Burkholderia sp. b14]
MMIAGIWYLVSGIWYPVSGIRYPVSGIRYPMFGVRCLVARSLRHWVARRPGPPYNLY